MKILDKSRIQIDGASYTLERRRRLTVLLDDAGTMYVQRDAAGHPSLPSEAEIAGFLSSGHAKVLPACVGRRRDVTGGLPTPIRRLSRPRSATSAPPEATQRTIGGDGDGSADAEGYGTERADDLLDSAVTLGLVNVHHDLGSAYEVYRRKAAELDALAGGGVVACVDRARFRRRAGVVEFLFEAAAPERLHRRPRRSGTVH